MDTATFDWSENATSVQQTAISGTGRSLRAVLAFRIAWSDLKECIRHLLGYADVGGATGDPVLRRYLPARHPRFPNLRCTSIMSITGEKPMDNIQAGQGYYGDWNVANVLALFEVPPFAMLPDEEVQAEYQRYVTRSYDPNVEAIARRGEVWKYLNQTVIASGQKEFTESMYIRQPKGVLRWTWHDVPDSWLMLGGLIPTNFTHALGKVNAKPFPQYAEVSQLDQVTPVQFPPGTLLMLPPRISPASQVHRNVMSSNTVFDDSFFTKTRIYDVEISMLHFDPPNEETTKVYFEDFDTGVLPAITIQGHNLVPVKKAVDGYRWWAAVRVNGENGALPATPLTSSTDLPYQYYDFEKVFSYARGLNDLPLEIVNN